MHPLRLDWSEDQAVVNWRWGALQVEKEYERSPQAVVMVKEPPGVLVVEPLTESSTLNDAVVFNPDGTERIRLKHPQVVAEPSWNVGFYAAFEDPQGLVIVFSTTVGDFWGRPDWETGELRDVREWR